MSILISHPTGNRNVRAILQGLEEKGLLSEFHTTFLADANAAWIKFLPVQLRNEWLRKTYPVHSSKVFTHPLLEMARMLLPKLGIKGPVRREYGWASVDAVYHHVDEAVAKRINHIHKSKNIHAVYAYEDGALATFKQAKDLGLKCIYDLPIAYWETSRKLLNEEANRMPQWAVTIGGGTQDSEKKLDRKTQELALADIVVCPGQFVKDSIPKWAHEKNVITSPFGSPDFDANTTKTNSPDRPLRVLFAGSMGQRKGLGDLFAAFRILGTTNVELVVMGSLLAPMTFYKSELNKFTYEPGREHQKVLELMRSCDVLCLPSIVEGRALVMQEAMSQGLPVIITPNTGGADLIIEGETGFLVPIRSPKAIAEKISWMVDNRALLNDMGETAKKHALTYTWKKYYQQVIQNLLPV